VSTSVTLPLEQRIQLFVNAAPAERYSVDMCYVAVRPEDTALC
jgi:hypothetical protein